MMIKTIAKSVLTIYNASQKHESTKFTLEILLIPTTSERR